MYVLDQSTYMFIYKSFITVCLLLFEQNVGLKKCSKYYFTRTCRAAPLFTDCRWHSKFRRVNKSTRIIFLPAVLVTLQHELP
jgi:hypothetical protein